MITRIELTNFMSHEHTVIEPAAGLTVLVGPNNWGKSAIVAALQILCYNENSTYVVRHGERECSVRVETDDGHVIEWSRKNNSPRYVVDGEPFDRLCGRVPEKVHQALRMPLVEWENQVFDIHFGLQKFPVFLIDKPGTHAAQFFASSSDAIRLVEMQKRHREKLAIAQREKIRLEVESAQLNRELELLEPVVDLDGRLNTLEEAHAELQDLASQIKHAEIAEAELDRQQLILERHASEAKALASLSSPPELTLTGPLAQQIFIISELSGMLTAVSALADVLAVLATPPEFSLTEPLEVLAGNLATAAAAHEHGCAKMTATASLAAPPALIDVSALDRLVAQFLTCEGTVEQKNGENRALGHLVQPPQFSDTATLTRLIAWFNLEQQVLDTVQPREQLLTGVSEPPSLVYEVGLDSLIRSLESADSWKRQCDQVTTVLATLVCAPVPLNTTVLEDLLRGLEHSVAELAMVKRNLMLAEVALEEQKATLRQWGLDSGTCPTCGSRIDPDRLVAQTAAGVEGRSHA